MCADVQVISAAIIGVYRTRTQLRRGSSGSETSLPLRRVAVPTWMSPTGADSTLG